MGWAVVWVGDWVGDWVVDWDSYRPLGRPADRALSPLACRDTYSLPQLLVKLDLFFVVVFAVEAALKVAASGFMLRDAAYLRSGWNCLDFFIVVTGTARCALGCK